MIIKITKSHKKDVMIKKQYKNINIIDISIIKKLQKNIK